MAARWLSISEEKLRLLPLRLGAVREICRLSPHLESFLESVAERMCLSPRACQRILKVARTLADLDARDGITQEHLAEAISYREADYPRPHRYVTDKAGPGESTALNGSKIGVS